MVVSRHAKNVECRHTGPRVLRPVELGRSVQCSVGYESLVS